MRPAVSTAGLYYLKGKINYVYLLKLKSMKKYLVIDCYGDYYEVDNLDNFIMEWYGGEIGLEEGKRKIYEDCKVIELN